MQSKPACSVRVEAPGLAQEQLPQTVAECHAVIAQSVETVVQCRQLIEALALEVAQLREQLALTQERLKLDSKNSSKAPSSDGPASGKRPQRRASGRKRGAQPGHKGNFRALLEPDQVDQIIDCRPVEVCECGETVQATADEPIRH